MSAATAERLRPGLRRVGGSGGRAAPRRPAADLAAELGPLLDELIAAHGSLIAALERHRDAVSRADTRAVHEAAAEQERAHAVLARLNERRVALAGEGSATLTALARTLPEPARGAALAKTERLRALAVRARDLNAVVRDATRSLLGHVSGVMHQVAQRMSHAGTYGRLGRVDRGPAVVSMLDVRR